MSSFKPQLVMYVAGADPYREDQLGSLDLTIEGLKARDRLVFDVARENRAAVAVVLAGGYAKNVEDTVTIHSNTVHGRPIGIPGELRHIMSPGGVMRFLISFFAGAAALLAQGNSDWHREFPAFKIAGNLYYVGTADLAVYLIRRRRGTS